jgi:hypothetical protein
MKDDLQADSGGTKPRDVRWRRGRLLALLACRPTALSKKGKCVVNARHIGWVRGQTLSHESGTGVLTERFCRLARPVKTHF